jgi:Family of unknown function (DUF5522)
MIEDPKNSAPGNRQNPAPAAPLQEGSDFYMENGLCIFTKEFHLRRGSCCRNACRHCPYGLALPSSQDAAPLSHQPEN